MTTRPEITRCPWAGSDELMISYHDDEWGVPVHNDTKHLELLVLEGAQSGLSWRTVLNKRTGYRDSFFDFAPSKVAAMEPADVERLLGNPGIIRNRAKIESSIANAKALLDVASERGSFDDYIWSFVDGAPIVNRFASMGELPAQTELSVAIAKDLKRRGFRFLGPTTVYAYMQSAGLVNDHLLSCQRWTDLRG